MRDCIDTLKEKKKKIIFFDELPWLDSHKSGFLSSFGYFGNMYASRRDDLLVVICGSAASWIQTGTHTDPGAQIDLLIDRADRRINICEIKFSRAEFSIDKRYAAELANKLNVFRERTRTRKMVFITMITTNGVKQNDYYTNLVENNLTMEALFQ
ncbi:hypothetical protein [Niabella drilacis]|uniref:DUF234 domain-containing protein n=1 Tax=Niabella drilacis (strain DSM 25811 / CCM 8410 / CCUG 62505 / LMG 26954 / E90) TaxID=1285928 RepID=A0A1G6LJZ2_NIADE|nr:hypothetical protein [Niabella drilacis]SDC43494.1 hypothetical protein SAMN04487894_102374 [Niabella drilacis]